MSVKGLAGKVNNLYQTIEGCIRNPIKLAIPIALGLALSYSSR